MNNSAHALSLVTASESAMSNRRAFRHMGKPHWLLELIVGGILDVRSDGAGWRQLVTGEGILYSPGTCHEERVKKGVCTSKWVFFDWDGESFGSYASSGGSVWKLCDPEGLALRWLEKLCALPRISPAARIGAHGYLCCLVSLLLAASVTDDALLITDRGEGMASVVDRANRFMRRHIGDVCRAADVAQHVGLSLSGLHHAYRRISGRSPMSVLREMRVEAAKAMLLHGAMNLDQIAFKTGFADAFHLSRTFKKKEGLSPRAFLRQAYVK